jgi:flagellar biosynthesis GTPase FlhF
MEQRDYTWSSIFAWGLTLSGATLATGGVIGMFWPQLDISWLCVIAFAAMMAFGIGLVNCAASGAMHAIKHRKADGGKVDYAVLLPALLCCIGFAFATNIGVHMGWEIVKANAPAGAHLPPAATVDIVFYIFAFAKPAMAWIVEGRKAMDAETMANRHAQRRREAAELAAAEAAVEAEKVEAEAAEKKSRARRKPKTEEENREAARKAVARRAASFSIHRMQAQVRDFEQARAEQQLTAQQIARACDKLIERGEKPNFRRVAEIMGVPRERIESAWPKGVPLDGTGEVRAA